MAKGIYKITNDRTGEVYVGQAKNIESRWNRHLRELAKGQHHNSGMQKDHDIGDTFSFEILEEIPNATKADLYNKEAHYVKKYNSFREGYNQTPGGAMDQFKGKYEYGGGRLPSEKHKPTDAYRSNELDSEFPIKFCPHCGIEVKKPTLRCIKCGKIFFDFDKKIDDTIVQTEDFSNVKTKHIDEAGVSFDFPKYYLLADIPDNAPDCVIALAKEDGACDLMVELSSSKDRIKYEGANFISAYKKYISDLGYYDIKTISGFGSKKACFQSYINHELGTIKQTTYFDFRFKKDIRITFNTLKNVDYNCMDDLKVIESSINYKTFKNSLLDHNYNEKQDESAKNKINSLISFLFYRNDEDEIRLSKTKIMTLIVFLIVVIGNIINPENHNTSLLSLIVIGITIGSIIAIPTYVIGNIFHNISKKDNFDSKDKTIMNYLFYYKDELNEVRLSKIKCLSWIIAIFVGLLIDIQICLIPNSQGIYAANLIFCILLFGFIAGIITYIFSSIIVKLFE
ncbi:MAG: GIY-YIG nuclease family protein [Methanobrevibacter sp.]|nr:GIY-YIG nuclease family protein [Methanobrevibacter sp.]